MKPRRRFRKVFWLLCAALLLSWAAPLLVPMNYLRQEVAASLSEAIGRPVNVGSVHLQLLGGPGFYISGVVVEEDPTFGYEPFLRAETVEARLAPSTLWHGRIEYSNLVLIRPSFNVVRNVDGAWNVALLGTNPASRPDRKVSAAGIVGLADTPPSLPRIRVESGRINFKIGERKKGASIQALDLDLVPPLSPQQPWRFDAEAMPQRTDIPFRFTSPLRVSGEIGPFSPEIQRETGVPLRVDWSATDAMLSELLAIAWGQEPGIHSVMRLEGHLAGTTSLFRFNAEGRFDDLHRWDLLAAPRAEPLRARMSGIVDLSTASLQLISFTVPLGKGAVEVHGRIEDLYGEPRPELEAELRELPLALLAAMAPQFTTRVPHALAVDGRLDGRLHIDPLNAEVFGTVQVSEASIGHSETSPGIQFAAFPVVFEGRKGSAGPIEGALADSDPLQMAFRWDWKDKTSLLKLRGGALSLPALADLGEHLGVGSNGEVRQGTLGLRVDVATRSGEQPRLSGWARVLDAELEAPAVTQPLHIAEARMQFQGAAVKISPLAVAIGATELRGTVASTLPANWVRTAEKEFQLPGIEFDLECPVLDWDELATQFRLPMPPSLFHLGAEETPLLSAVQAFPSNVSMRGRLRVGSVRWKSRELENLAVSVYFHERQLDLEDITARYTGGVHQGRASIILSNPILFTAEGRYSDVHIDELVRTSDSWRGLLSGRLSGTLRLASAGNSWEEIASQLTGTGEAHGRDVVVRSTPVANALVGQAARDASFASVNAEFEIGERQFYISSLSAHPAGTVRLAEERGPAEWSATGDVGFDQRLDLRVKRAGEERELHWAGTLLAPRITRTTSTAEAQVEASRTAR